jgi:hypothetical protein
MPILLKVRQEEFSESQPRHPAKAMGMAGRLRSGDAGAILTDPGRRESRRDVYKRAGVSPR